MGSENGNIGLFDENLPKVVPSRFLAGFQQVSNQSIIDGTHNTFFVLFENFFSFLLIETIELTLLFY